MSVFVCCLLLAACGEHARVSESERSGSLDPAEHQLVHDAVESIRVGQVEKGLSALSTLRSGRPEPGRSTEWLPSAIEALLGQGEYARAESLMSVVGAPSQRPADLRYWTAQLEMARGDHAAARPHFEAAFADPLWGIAALFEAAMLESARGGHEEAAALCRRLLARERHHDGARLLLASSLLETGQVDAAFDVARELSSENARASLFAHGHLLAGRPQQAWEVLQGATELRGPLREYLEGWARLELEDFAAAIRLLEPLAMVEPAPFKNSPALLAEAYRASGDEKAAERLERLIPSPDESIEAGRLQDEGVRAAQAGDFEEGRRLLAEAAELSPDDGTILNDLAAILTRLERYEAAEIQFLRAAQLRPNDAAIAANLSQLYTLMGDDEKAEEQRARYEQLRGN